MSIAIRTVADRAYWPNRGKKINLTGKKGFSVFPKGLEFVKVGELNFSAPCSQGERLWAAQTFGPASLLGLVIFSRSIPYLAHSPTLISLIKISCKYQSLWLIYITGDNNLRPHDLRRHSATFASRSGVPIEVVSKVILRHQNLSTTKSFNCVPAKF